MVGNGRCGLCIIIIIIIIVIITNTTIITATSSQFHVFSTEHIFYVKLCDLHHLQCVLWNRIGKVGRLL